MYARNRFETIKAHYIFEAFSQIVPKIEKEHSILFPSSEIVYFTLQLMSANYHYEDEHLAKKIITERIREDKRYIYSKVRLFVRNIESNLNVVLFDDTDLLFHLSICFRRVLYRFKMYPSKFILNYPPTAMNNSLVLSIKSKYPTIFNIVKEQYNLFLKILIMVLQMKRLQRLHYMYNLVLCKNITPIPIMLHVIEHPGMYRFLYAWIKNIFEIKLTFSLVLKLHQNLF